MSAPSLPGGLSLGPRVLERPADAGFTYVATLDSEEPARVDAAGLVQPFDVTWSVDWMIRGDDRWYLPARESTVRQRRIGAGAVLETSVRIPSGDAIQRVYAVNAAGGDAVVIEIENASPVPVALAMSIRPYGVEAEIGRFGASISDDAITVDGRRALLLPRPPNERQAASDADLVRRLVAGNVLNGADSAPAVAATNGTAPDLPTAAVVYPLPHGTTLQFVVPHPDAPAALGPLPDPTAVARGWSSVIDRGGRFRFPDSGITQQAMAARARLLAETPDLPSRVARLEPGSGRILEALATSGAVAEIMGSLGALAGTFHSRLPGSPRDAAAVVAGVGRAARLLDDEAVAEALLEPVAQLTYLVEKVGSAPEADEALLGLARLLIAAHQSDVATDLLARVSSVAPAPDIPSTLDDLVALAEQASPAGSWGADEVVRAAEFWLGARRLVIGGDPTHLRLLPVFPTAWLGGDLEVHNATTTHGSVSFAIRWHGARPALLWELEREPERGPIEIRCPGLDPDFVTSEPSGDALLAGTPTGLAPTPVEGESFA